MANSKGAEYGWHQDMPMSLHDKIRADLKTSMRNKAAEVKSTMRLIMAEFPKLTVPLTLESGKKTTRLKTERIVLEAKSEETSEYLEILESYLPKMATREEVVDWIKANIDFSQFKNKMQAMGTIMKHFGKLADGKMVNLVLREWD
jgi:uncharacterized protein YqeY